MKLGILGTGQVGSALAGRLVALGHEVMVGSRSPQGEKAQALAAASGARVGSYEQAASHGEWVINALPGEASVPALKSCAIGGKILIDIANYDSAVDQPIMVPVGQLIQDAFPEVRLIKALNSVSAHLMAEPARLGRPHSVFVAGNDRAAKAEVMEFLGTLGWQDVIDLGGLSACRAMEQLIPLWMALEQVEGGPGFNLAVMRQVE